MSKIVAPDFKIESLTPLIGDFKTSKPDEPYTGFNKNYLVLDLGKKEKGDFATVNFSFESEKYKITSCGASCGCTKPSFQNIDGKQVVTVYYDPSKITKNVEKNFTLYLNNDMELKIKSLLIINKD